MDKPLAHLVHSFIHKITCTIYMRGFKPPTDGPKQATVFPKMHESLSAKEKAKKILSEMNIKEKIDILSGRKIFAIKGNDRLKLPEVWTTDATAGIRMFGDSTVFPSALAMASTWNKKLIGKIGSAIAIECKAKGISVILAPGVNIARVPTCGRNFEYMGEDPYLTSKIACSYIKGVQDNKVIATIKHFACNNSDYDRHRMNAIVDERTLNEIYLPAFESAVKEAKVKAVMCSYNPINGVWASENRTLLTDVLRTKWGFKGIVMSDWQSVYSAKNAIKAGLDLEMPTNMFYKEKKILSLIAKGDLSQSDIDQRVYNILYTFFEMGIYSKPQKQISETAVRCQEHQDIALKCAKEAIVLCKNSDSFLPMSAKKVKSVVVIGENAIDTPTSGGGSAYVDTKEAISIANGLKKRCKIEYIPMSIKDVELNADAIEDADSVIVCAGFNDFLEREGYDRSWQLPGEQGEVINIVGVFNPNVIVVLTSGGDVETESWINSAKAILHTIYLGEKSGEAIASIVFGEENPSGKLPFTMAKNWSNHSGVSNYVKKPSRMSFLRMAGPQGIRWIRGIKNIEYKEGIFVGYRHFDTRNIEPQFSFGHGLSYTKFEISNISSSKEFLENEKDELRVSFLIKNVGQFAGSEVVQLYISQESPTVEKPKKELKGFEKIFLEKNASETLSFNITKKELAHYCVKQQNWKTEKGVYKALIGTSSRDIVATFSFEVK